MDDEHETPFRDSVVPDFWALHVVPLVVPRIVPPAPTATQVDGGLQEIPRSACVVPDDSVVQVVPPSVVARIVPPAPTAKQSALVGHEIPESVGAVPGVWLVQVDPPSVVASMWPLSMATKQSELVGHEMAFAVVKRSVVIWPAHVVPPFVVAQTLILPGEGTPTAQHFDALAHAIPLKLDVVGEV
jgi:hypothetical protein